MLVRPLSTVDNTRDYARVSHSRQWSNYNISSVSEATGLWRSTDVRLLLLLLLGHLLLYKE